MIKNLSALFWFLKNGFPNGFDFAKKFAKIVCLCSHWQSNHDNDLADVNNKFRRIRRNEIIFWMNSKTLFTNLGILRTKISCVRGIDDYLNTRIHELCDQLSWQKWKICKTVLPRRLWGAQEEFIFDFWSNWKISWHCTYIYGLCLSRNRFRFKLFWWNCIS